MKKMQQKKNIAWYGPYYLPCQWINQWKNMQTRLSSIHLPIASNKGQKMKNHFANLIFCFWRFNTLLLIGCSILILFQLILFLFVISYFVFSHTNISRSSNYICMQTIMFRALEQTGGRHKTHQPRKTFDLEEKYFTTK